MIISTRLLLDNSKYFPIYFELLYNNIQNKIMKIVLDIRRIFCIKYQLPRKELVTTNADNLTSPYLLSKYKTYRL